jgi:trehalose 6-phosphate synthase/phosphatase
MNSRRLLIVSNRLPVTARPADGELRLFRSSGGLANGLRPWHEDSGGIWIGWPGDVTRLSPQLLPDLERRLTDRAMVPVFLTAGQIDRYYQGFSNRVLWPLLHYSVDRMPVEATGWDAYREVNQVFADTVTRVHRAGDVIWVHDYQLMLLPALLRERLAGARIGFFLHVPFPAAEVFRVLPWRRELLQGVLGADLLGFHTFSYLRHFVDSLQYLDGVETDNHRVRTGAREVALGVFPMGVDARRFSALAGEPDVLAEVRAIRREAAGRRIVLGVDRLDYTKGIPRRLHSLERLLSRDPDLRERVRYIQVAVPSRGEVDSYQRFKREVEEKVGRFNGAWGTLRSTPLHYVHRSVSLRQLVALYCAADVMIVTPLRDGMNLVAKEFAASRIDEDGVLVLSEFAGAAAELGGAMLANPYDVDAVAESLWRALSMPAEERRARMQSLRRRVIDHDVHSWARGFLEQLDFAQPATVEKNVVRFEASLVTALSEAQRRARLHLLIDYDGTLVPFAGSPELAAPDAEVVSLLERLQASPGIELEIVSGRPRETVESWFGDLPLSLWAEHGFWHRAASGKTWRSHAKPHLGGMERVRTILEQFTEATPGSRIETKSASIAWHYRGARSDFAQLQARELRLVLQDALIGRPFELLEGNKVLEVRPHGVSKAIVARRIRGDEHQPAVVVAIGDDRTDEDLFRALPGSSLTVAVGKRPTGAKYRVEDFRAVRRILRRLVANAGSKQTIVPNLPRENAL